MQMYRYRAKTEIGGTITGVYEAAGRPEVISMLKNKGLYPVLIEKKHRGRALTAYERVFKRVRQRDLTVFCRQFSTIISAGVPILTSLDILRDQTENARLRETLGDLYKEVQKGRNLSYVMAMHRDIFPELLINMVEAGEISGTLYMVLDRMADHYEKEYKLNQRIKTALIYPALTASVALIVIAFIVTVVLPVFASMFEQAGVGLPLITKILLMFSRFVQKRRLFLMLSLGVFLLGLNRYLRTKSGRKCYDMLKLSIPGFRSINKMVLTVRFSRALGMLIACGIPILQSIKAADKIMGNVVVSEAMGSVERDIKKGMGLAEPLKKMKLFPPMLVHMINIGENTGTLDYMLTKTADFYDGEMDGIMNAAAAIVEPVVIIVMATVVTFIMLSVIIPMLHLMTGLAF